MRTIIMCYQITHNICRWDRRFLAIVFLATVLAGAAQVTTSSPPATTHGANEKEGDSLKAIDSVFSTKAGYYSHLTISSGGDVTITRRVNDASAEEVATGHLTNRQIEELARLFRDWDRLKQKYGLTSNDPRWERLTYDGKTVEACVTSGAPPEFIAASRTTWLFATR